MDPSAKSFATRTRDALTWDAGPRARKACCVNSEISGYILANGTVSLLGGHGVGMVMRTEHAGTARWVVRRLRQAYLVMPVIRIIRAKRLGGRTTFELRLKHADMMSITTACGFSPTERLIPRACMTRKCCRSALLRGMFLGCGTLIDPERGYRLEFVLPDESLARALVRFLSAFYAIQAKLVERKEQFVVYLTDGDDIVQLLSLIGAHGAILELENVRILRDARNRANRAANCDAANATKMSGAADRQLRAIGRIERTIGLPALPPALREIAAWRLQHPDASLEELGAMLNPPVGKSGVHHRLRRLEAIARSLDTNDPRLSDHRANEQRERNPAAGENPTDDEGEEHR